MNPDRHRQLATELPPGTGGGRGVALSASKELEPGVRAMILTAKDLFRLDVTVSGDALRTIVRNLSTGELSFDEVADEPPRSFGFGEIGVYEPGVASLSFALGSGTDRVAVTATIATLRFAQRGTIRVTVQAVVRDDPMP